MDSDFDDPVLQLTCELKNFEEIGRYFTAQPADVPRLPGIDVYGGTLPLSGSIGGDHLIYIDFKQCFDLDARIERAIDDGKPEVVANLRRCEKMAGIVLLDVSGHRMTDAFLAATLHQAFLLGAIYELDLFGRVTKRLFENLNTRLYQSSSDHKFVSMMYVEISEDARFRFLAAAQPFPVVFSREYGRIVDTRQDLCASYPPLGILPSLHVTDSSKTTSVLGFKEDYMMNHWGLEGAGDIVLLHTDGLVDHYNGDDYYAPERLEQQLRRVKDRTAAEIFRAIKTDIQAFGKPSDDISLVVIKRA